MEVFEEALLRNFEDEMVQHIKQFTPRQFKSIGEGGIRQVIRAGIERAKTYGLTNRGPVRFYIELMFMLGSDFDTDPQYSWADEILNDLGIVDQMARAERLYDEAMNYIRKVSGPEYKYEKDAIQRVGQMLFENLPTSVENFEGEMAMCLNRIYPQKFEYMGEAAINELIDRGNEVAESHTISNSVGVALFVVMMFAFGHGCFTDPKFPWLAEILKAPSINVPPNWVERLFSDMILYLNRELANMMEER